MRLFVASTLSPLFLISSMITTTTQTVAAAASDDRRHLQRDFVQTMNRLGAQQQQQQRLKQRRDESFLTKVLPRAKPLDETAKKTSVDYSYSHSSNSNRRLQDQNGDDMYAAPQLNLTEYALKYVGCQNIHAYSDELAEEQTNVLGMDRFVILRLCPRSECSNYNRFGCNSGFGDWAVEMSDYLMAMKETYLAEYQEYCETCNSCMNLFDSSSYAYAAQGDDGNAAQGDDGNMAQGDDGYAAQGNDGYNNNNNRRRRRHLANNQGNYYYSANDYNNMNYDECAAYYDACTIYERACKDYTYKADDLSDYFECSAFNVGNNNNAGGSSYLGPHCRSDGHTIGIGIYRDESCSTYIGDLVDIGTYTGMDIQDDYLKAYYSDTCMSCLASDGYAFDDLNQNQNGQNQNQNNGQQEAQASEICEALVEESAMCNKFMGNDAWYMSSRQEDNEKKVCNFIDALMTNSYDEYGEVILDNSVFHWKTYASTVRQMTGFQKFMMSISTMLVVFLSGYSCYLHRKLSRRKFRWTPRSFGDAFGNTTPILASERMQSGIMAERSQSDSSKSFTAARGTMA